MWKSWPTSGAPVAEAIGSRLVTLSASAVVAMLAGNFLPPNPAWGAPLVAAGLLAAWRGLAGDGRRLGWWASCGVVVGLAACALAPRAPGGVRGAPVPVRFVITVRDGWIGGARGLGTRVLVSSLELAGHTLPGPREMDLYVTAATGLARLPHPGTSWEGSGELVYDGSFPLKAGYLRVKTLLLLRPLPGGSTVDRLREAGVQALRAGAGVDPVRLHAAALASALVLERREELLEGEVASMRRSGLVHLLSVSGLHVGLVGVLAWGALSLVQVRPKTRRWVVAAVLVGFALLAGGNAPVRRAAAAGVAYIVARQLGRPREPLPTVWAIVSGLAVLEPAVLLQPGFELSAFVTLALVRWIGPLATAMRVLPRRLAQGLAVTLVAQAASSPLVGAYFAVVPPLGVVANLLAAPLELVLVGGSLLALLLAPVSATLGGVALMAVAFGQNLLDRASTLGGALSLPFAPFPALLAVALAGMGVLALTRVRASNAAAGVMVLATIAWMGLPALHRPWTHELRVLGVREGMALLVRNGPGAVLIDAGRSPLDAWRELARARVRRLEALVVTHQDADHTGGAAMLLERLPVGRLCYPQALGERAEIAPLRRLARLRGIEEVSLAHGQRVELAGIQCDLLWPPPAMEGVDNDASLAMRLTLGGIRVLITGDLEAPGEAAILARGFPLRAEVLQLPHHGSRTSSSQAFLEAVQPVIALAATGVRPRFAYPHPTVARRTLEAGAVLVVQGGGVATVGWESEGRLAVGAAEPVMVSRRRGRDVE